MLQPIDRFTKGASARAGIASRTGIVALVPDDFVGPWSTRHHVLTRLASYYPVVWVEPSREWREHWLSLPWRQARPRAADSFSGLKVLEPRRLQPQLYRPRWLRRVVRRARFNSARNLLLEQGAERIALYIWRPQFADALDLMPHDFSCYHIDDEYSFAKIDQGNSPEEVALISSVNQVIVHSPRLMEKKGGINPRTALIPNGVDFHAYVEAHPEPPDLARIPGPRVGYIGVIKSQLDIELMIQVAQRMTGASFVFVGPIGVLGDKQSAWERFSALPNVHVLGNRDVTQLPAYTQHFDVCLMCYEVNDYTHAIYPLKLNEYLASGRPVVASRINSVLPFQAVVRLASTTQEWVAAIEAGIAEKAVEANHLAEARQQVARKHDWNRLVENIAELFRP